MKGSGGSDDLARANEKVRRSWAREAPRYEKRIGFFERRVFGPGHREWACSRASGDTLEVAVGTGLNLPFYPDDVRLTGVDLSPEMLALARKRAAELGRQVELREGDAHALDLDDASFDVVLCTYSLCNIPDPERAVGEMKRVLRPGGKLVLVDHIRGASKPVYWIQTFIEFFSLRFEGEHMTRRPLEYVRSHQFVVSERDRLGLGGVVERLVAVKAVSDR